MKYFKAIENDKYIIFRDGSIYGQQRNKWLKPQYNNAGYVCYFIVNKWLFAHRLVYSAFSGEISPNKEVNHIDMDKTNNYIDNLEQVTHKENIIKARQNKQWTAGRTPGYKHSEETKSKMAAKKLKQIAVEDMQGNTIEVFNSVHDLLTSHNWYRRKFNRIMKDNNGIYNNTVFKYI